MKKLFLLCFTISFSSYFAQTDIAMQPTDKRTSTNVPDTSLNSFIYITLSDAIKTLEEPAHLIDSTWKFEGGSWKFQCKYLGDSMKDNITWKNAELYFGFEQYKKVSEAKSFYDFMKIESGKTSTIINLFEIGDEGFSMQDKLNNPFLMVRKGRRIYKLKTYHLTSTTTPDKLKLLAKKIIPAH